MLTTIPICGFLREASDQWRYVPAICFRIKNLGDWEYARELLAMLAADSLASLSLLSRLWARVWFLPHRTYAPSGHNVADKNSFEEYTLCVDFTCFTTTSRFNDVSRYYFRSISVKPGSRREQTLPIENWQHRTIFFALPMIAEPFCKASAGMVLGFLWIIDHWFIISAYVVVLAHITTLFLLIFMFIWHWLI